MTIGHGWSRALAGTATAALMASAALVDAQQADRTAPHTLQPIQSRVVAGIKILPVRNNVYVLMGAGGNITVLGFPEGVTLVDSGLESSSDNVLAAIRSLSNQPITYIINTHVHADHVGGNQKLALTGRQIIGGNVVGNEPDIGRSAEIIAHENVLNRMIDPKVTPPVPSLAQPATTYHTDTLKLSTLYHGDAIQLFSAPAAHTDGDTIVWFRHNDVIATGDVFTPASFPRIDLDRGGSINGEIDALNHIIDIAFPEFRLENGTLIVPGHGRLCDVADVAYYRDMVTIVRDRVQDMKKRGQTLMQVQAAGVTKDYDGIYGTSPDYTPAQFVEAVYMSLPASVRPANAGAAAPANRRGQK
jgi:glyoxylase-like metal-dependent hydrolase (beta-lactamase superfamily II)